MSLKERKLSKILRKSPPALTFRPSEDYACAERRVGIELEAERVDTPIIELFEVDYNGLFNVSRDDSLRNNGIEFKTLPVFGRDIDKCLNVIERELYGNVEINERCGVHIHVDVTDLSLDQFISAMMIYSLYEETLFKFVGGERENNIYCVPFKNIVGVVSRLISDIKNVTDDTLVLHNISSWQKYSAINLGAMARFGTVEFRHFPSTCNAHVIKEWVQIALAIINAGVEVPMDTMSQFCNDIINKPTNIYPITERILTKVPRNFISLISPEDAEDGALTAKLMVNYRDFTDGWAAAAKSKRQISYFNAIYGKKQSLKKEMSYDVEAARVNTATDWAVTTHAHPWPVEALDEEAPAREPLPEQRTTRPVYRIPPTREARGGLPAVEWDLVANYIATQRERDGLPQRTQRSMETTIQLAPASLLRSASRWRDEIDRGVHQTDDRRDVNDDEEDNF